jgi:hypothetical protein
VSANVTACRNLAGIMCEMRGASCLNLKFPRLQKKMLRTGLDLLNTLHDALEC